MKNILQRIHAFSVKLLIVWFILIILVLDYLISLIYYPLSNIINDTFYSNNQGFFSLPLWLQIVLSIPSAYFITILHLWLIFKIFRHFKYFINKNFIIIIISSFLLCLYSLFLGSYTGIIITFLSGLLLGYSHIVAEEKKLSPVLIVTIIIFLEMVIENSISYTFYK
ncbi:MAG: hypothetical protein HZB41_13545 [Ignavibacteriae bacterium]|nr:hypothetical protein [Ignavibacteriota bacterium]